jgi:hypothetical protein
MKNCTIRDMASQHERLAVITAAPGGQCRETAVAWAGAGVPAILTGPGLLSEDLPDRLPAVFRHLARQATARRWAPSPRTLSTQASHEPDHHRR